jgi:hypothetical protein
MALQGTRLVVLAREETSLVVLAQEETSLRVGHPCQVQDQEHQAQNQKVPTIIIVRNSCAYSKRFGSVFFLFQRILIFLIRVHMIKFNQMKNIRISFFNFVFVILRHRFPAFNYEYIF